ncbi:uncharacterized protein LOC130047523 isoform X1 [Ostrea edulis]|uniref:uncharacterized protein LOC130047523 isoform X1 n=1 Tax=Ostrea edulis TaxID=37623 RepID=UPI0024AFBF2D|nr:uncharacterized protein LOC130047523 isoform X1 [Ostrea edulis]
METIPKIVHKNSSKRLKNKKPFWNDELRDLWNNTREKENMFVKYKGKQNVKSALRREYIEARDIFDKALRRTERSYKKTVARDIENMSSSNPNEFWNKIKKLGPRNTIYIPMEVIDTDGNIITNEREVLNRWQIDFQNLYNGSVNTDFFQDHYDSSRLEKTRLENNMKLQSFICNEELNYDISLEEISDIVLHSKSKSDSGYDEIPYSVLKFPMIIKTLRNLFQLIFDSSIIPSIWRKAIICPILKDSSSDKHLPMNYRGISLLSCISKLYSAFINKRLVTYLENNDILADEQNGFRRGRSCEDHIET